MRKTCPLHRLSCQSSYAPATANPRWTSLRTHELVEFLFERNDDLEVSESTIIEARTVDVMKVLLKYASNMKVTPDMLSTAAGIGTDNRSGFMERDLVLLLLAHDETATVPQNLSRTIPTSYWDTGTLNYLTILLNSAPDLQFSSGVSADILQHLIKKRPYRAHEVQCGKNI